MKMTFDAVAAMTRNRLDMTDWVVHFVRKPNLAFSPITRTPPFVADIDFPYHEDRRVDARFDLWRSQDKHPIVDDPPSAFSVLRKILHDGHIRSSWAFRNQRPTIYGSRAAVCFSEMPLHALLDYAERRGEAAVDKYAIGILKEELFRAGGRPAIYGLSSEPKELPRPMHDTLGWPRKLDPADGLPESEQYRYVRTSFSNGRRIDWTHEREWRWVDHEDRYTCPGLPIWLDEQPATFSRVLVLVPTIKEADVTLDLLKQLHDTSSEIYDIRYDKAALANTMVLSLERVRQKLSLHELNHLRFEDVPKMHLQRFEAPQVSEGPIARVETVHRKARQAAEQAGEWLPTGSERSEEDEAPGYAYLTLNSPRSDLVAALLQLDLLFSVPEDGYLVDGIGGFRWKLGQARFEVEAARQVYEESFPECNFGTHEGLDPLSWKEQG